MYREHSEMMLRIHGISANDWLLTSEITKELQELKKRVDRDKKGMESNGY